ncbi:MAG: carotenoid oxygenase family protein [Nitrospinae bacterium]|nr:carotenoid oxygenase family protein [Nitrospinota bacterium]
MNRRDFLIHVASTSTVLALGTSCSGWRPRTDWPANLFLQGNFAPVQEEITADHLTVIGTLPPEMDGMYVRNGPNPQFPPIKSYHWFEGDGMLHGVRVQGGRASYRNRYIRTAGWQEEHEAGKAVYGSFLDPSDFWRKLWRILVGKPQSKHTANTAVVWHDGRLLALMEAAEPYEIKVPSLDTVGPYTYGGRLKHAFTAHPKVDPATGELLFFGYAWRRPYVQYGVVNAQGQIARTTPIDIPRPIMMHDFAVTARYSLFMDLPLTFSISRMLRGGPMLTFEPELGARFGILPRHGTGQDIKWFEVSPCYVFHTLNAYEDGEEVVLLACRTQEFPAAFFMPPGIRPVGGDRTGKEFTPVMYRWRLNLKTGTTREEALDEVPSDFPRINDGLMGRQTRYGYTAGFAKVESSELLKYDYGEGSTERHAHGRGRFGGEGVFVPRPNARAEDDGWLVTYVYDAGDGTSEMVVIDAQDFRKPPVARVRIPARVPYGFHGAWISGERLAQQG